VRDGGLRPLDCGAGRRAEIDQIGRVNEGGYPIGGASFEEVAILLRISGGRRPPARVGDEDLDGFGADLTGMSEPFDGQPTGDLDVRPDARAWPPLPHRPSVPGVSPLLAEGSLDAAATLCRPTGGRSLARHVIPGRGPPGTGKGRRSLTTSDGSPRCEGRARPILRCVKGTLVPSRDV
jgi:hypothetical protein